MNVDPESIAAAALRSRSVSALFPGNGVEVATYLPGKRVTGVRVRDEGVEVHVVAHWGASLSELADEVRRLVSPVAGGLPVSVYIDELDVPDEESDVPTGGSPKSA